MPRELFEKAIDDISFADITRLISSGAEEGIRLELKRELSANSGQRDPWMLGQNRLGNSARDDVAKEVVAFANAYGGMVIIGVAETSDHPKRAHQLADTLVPRVAECAERLRQSLQQIIDPPLRMLEVKGIPQPGREDGSGVILIRTAASPLAPHGYGRPPATYVRRGSHSEPLTMRDLQSLLFDARSRAERIDAVRQQRANVFRDLERRRATGRLRSMDGTPIENARSLAFRCTLVPTDPIQISALMSHSELASFSRPTGLTGPSKTSPAFGAGSFGGWEPRAGGFMAESRTLATYSLWFLGNDGLLEVVGFRGGSLKDQAAHHPGWYSVTVGQLMVMAEDLRRRAGRPEVEFALDCQIINGQQAEAVSGDGYGHALPDEEIALGPYSIGPREGFQEVHNLISREIWHSFGFFGPAQPDVDFGAFFSCRS